MTSMKLGAVFPTTEIGDDPAVLRDWVQAAEGLGYDHVVVYDHVLGAVHAGRQKPLMGPYAENHPFHEPLIVLTYLAALTKRIELVTGILILPQRQTALVAKQAAELDLLSGGRLRLGVGSGWNYVEYEALGVPWETRGKRFDEQVELLRRLWTEPVVDYSGVHHRIDRAGILPRPRRQIPIWFGSFSPVALRRAARMGDGILFGSWPTRMLPLLGIQRELLDKQGRGRAEFGAEAIVDYSEGPDFWKREAEVWREAGGTHLTIRAMDTAAEFLGSKHVGYSGPKAYIQALEEFRDALR